MPQLFFVVSCIWTIIFPMASLARTDLPYELRADDQGESDNLDLSLSLKYWLPTVYFDLASPAEKNTIKAVAPMYAMGLNMIGYEKYYLGLGFYTGNGFELSDGGIDYTAAKSDLDVWLGWIFPHYIGFWGGALYPPSDAEISKFCSQFL